MTDIRISDHAIIRYLERVRGLDIESVRWAIAHVVREAVEAGATTVKAGGLTYMIRDNTVTTIVEGSVRNAAMIRETYEASR